MWFVVIIIIPNIIFISQTSEPESDMVKNNLTGILTQPRAECQ